jgi:prepilin-type N-terminal cleavage/methylation domain-containing protein
MKMFEQKRASDRTHRQRSAFTLIEMMVVVALVGILIGGVFRLLNAAGEGAKRGETIERMQRIENALSGFYAAYGSYPPVEQHGSPDPFVEEAPDGTTSPVSSLEAENANRAAASQPMAFEFPPMQALDDYIATRFQSQGILSPNRNPGIFTQSEKWPQMKLYRYGVVSFLVPRYDAIGDFTLDPSNQYEPRPIDTKLAPNEGLYKNHKQWTDYNPARKAKAEREACARWLPNLRGIVRGGRKLLGVETGVPHCDNESQLSEGGNANRAYEYKGGGSKYFLRKMTIQDAWGNDFYYHSAPPYQSYRLWSAGPDGVTFPADYPLQQLNPSDRKTVSGWIKDDIARPSR